jgi:hypothetical protein
MFQRVLEIQNVLTAIKKKARKAKETAKKAEQKMNNMVYKIIKIAS